MQNLPPSHHATTPLAVHPNRRFLQHTDGRPFFWLGDTAWELFHRMTREDADLYLADRARKGFTVIQAVALAEVDGLQTPNAYGHLPLHDLDPTRPNEAYFGHVDYIIDKAANLGMWTGLLPTWGDKYNRSWGVGPEVFTPENARTYGAWLGERYRNRPVIWILGGDRRLETDRHVQIIRAMAAGIRESVGPGQLICFHPQGQESSARYFPTDDWCDLHLYQTGHTFNRDNYRSISEDYARTPPKPCLDVEPGYEDHPNGWKPETGWLDDYECRKYLWGALFAGACGHTYGCHDIWQFWEPGREAVSAARTPWREALDLPGAGQMQIAKNLLLARPFFDRVPAPNLLAAPPAPTSSTSDFVLATRDTDGGFALVYSASGAPFAVRMDKIGGGSDAVYRAEWLDPRTGDRQVCGDVAAGSGDREWLPPTRGHGCDWVLVLDRA